MKLAVILSRVPYPLDKGDKLRAYHQIKGLSSKHKICLICTTDEPIDPRSVAILKEFCEEVHVFRLSKILIWLRLALALFSKKPFQVHYFHTPFVQRKVNKVLARFAPDHIYAQLIRTTEYVKNMHHIPKTMDYMDAFNKGYDRRKSQSKGLLRWFFGEESKRLLAYEHLIFDYFDHHTIISEQDKKLIYHNLRDKIIVIPNGVDQTYFKSVHKNPRYDILFTGNMAYPPNESSALYLLQTIMPLVRKEKPQTTVVIAGSSPGRKLTELASEQNLITGRLDDIRTAYESCRIFVAPMLLGTGLQNKLLEAMAMKMPCITSQLANNALQAIKDEQVLIGNDAQEYANYILYLMDNDTKSSELGAKGLEFINRNFNWDRATNELDSLISLRNPMSIANN